ncbi:MAG: regulatory protein RecX [Candidatus Euphemobacter frigidus]|nr:regulatory protein RecX [Candidatus Euphemobacter frigidus]MDP8275304.1 regulatory protein RecX [Candidatus Euphemobacter frigidus]
MKDGNEYSRAWESALRLLNYRERSRKELSDKLGERHYPTPVITRIIEKLERLELLDDEKFARLWVRSRLRFKPRSAWLIRRELKEKGLDEELISRVVEEEYPPDREMGAAVTLARKRFDYYRGDQPAAAWRKLFAYLARRGFSPDTIRECIDKVITKVGSD